MKTKKYDWGNILFLGGYHLLLLILLPIYLFTFGFPLKLFVISFILVHIAGIAITAGYHRLFSHQAYKAHPIAQWIFLFWGTVATQGSALKWCYDHRKHHAFIDQDEDPYTIKKGFWYAHFLWMMKKADPIDPKVVPDLMKNRAIMFQHRHYVPLMLLSNALVILFFGALFHNYFGAFVFTGLVRMFLLHHFTWFINSLAHTWGTQNYSREHSAVDNYILCVLTFGEGYHNYHHTFANDYRNGIRWYHYDPTKWVILLLAKLGLAKDLRKASDQIISRKLIEEHKRELKERLMSSYLQHKEKIIEKLEEHAARLQEKVGAAQLAMHNYQESKKQQGKEKLIQLRHEIKRLKKNLDAEWRQWDHFVDYLHQTLAKSHHKHA